MSEFALYEHSDFTKFAAIEPASRTESGRHEIHATFSVRKDAEAWARHQQRRKGGEKLLVVKLDSLKN